MILAKYNDAMTRVKHPQMIRKRSQGWTFFMAASKPARGG
jgi:hypothetical protein